MKLVPVLPAASVHKQRSGTWSNTWARLVATGAHGGLDIGARSAAWTRGGFVGQTLPETDSDCGLRLDRIDADAQKSSASGTCACE
jgi:hypothetical protein